MKYNWRTMAVFAAAFMNAVAISAYTAESRVERRVIWDVSRIEGGSEWRIEFPDLVRFKGSWFCAFREGEIHGNHPSGRGSRGRSSVSGGTPARTLGWRSRGPRHKGW